MCTLILGRVLGGCPQHFYVDGGDVHNTGEHFQGSANRAEVGFGRPRPGGCVLSMEIVTQNEEATGRTDAPTILINLNLDAFRRQLCHRPSKVPEDPVYDVQIQNPA